MANWSNPQLTTTYTDFLNELKDRDTDLALQFNGTTSTNIPSGTIQWDGTANRWKKWTGAAWGELATTYALTTLTTSGNATIAGNLTVSGSTTLGIARATTPATPDNSTNLATTAYVRAQNYAPLSSPTLGGTPTAPTASVGTNTTQIATTAFVNAEISNDAILKTGGTLTGDLVLFSGAPSAAQSAVPRSYIDSRDWKQSVRCASTAAFTVVPTGVTILRSSSNGALSIDSVSPSVGDRVLLTAQASGWQNGIYQVTDAGSVSTPWILTRPADADSWDEIAGSAVSSRSGTSNGDKIFLCTSDTGGTLGTTSINWQVTFASYINSLIGVAGSGIVTKSGDTAFARSIAVSGSGLTVTNADGAAGNPTIALASASDNTIETVVFRDSNGGFSAGTINLKTQNSLRLEASGSTNYIGLRAPATVTTSTLLTLPNGAGSDGQMLSTNGTGTLSWTTPLGLGSIITSGTAVASTSGTTIDFTNIPSWTKRITVMFTGVSTNGTSNLLIQLGNSDGVEEAGYNSASSIIASAVATVNQTTGFRFYESTASAAALFNGHCTIALLGSNTWTINGIWARSDAARSGIVSGTKTLTSTLDRIRITTVGGANTFDAGTINIMYEG